MTEPIRLYTVKEVAALLRVSVGTVYRLQAKRLLRPTHIGVPGSKKPATRYRANEVQRCLDRLTK